MDATFIGIVSVVALLALLAVGIHVAVALAGVSIVGLLIISDFQVTASLSAHVLYGSVATYSFVLVPLFILMGHFASAAGIVQKAMHFAYTWLGRLRGGLALATTASCAIFAAACGSSSATAAAMGKFVIPEMERYGYDRKLATGTVAASGTLGVLIPPSIVLVVYGLITEESIGRLLIAGIVPGVLSAIIYMIGITLVVHRWQHLAPPAMSFPWKERIKSVRGLWGVLLLVGIIWGGIYGGVFTPTEAGGIGAFAALLLLVFRLRPSHAWREIRTAIPGAVETTAMVFIIMVAAVLFSKFLTLSGVMDSVVAFILGHEWPAIATIALILSVVTIMGCFMSSMAVLLIVAPMTHLVLTSLGFDGIWVGIILVKLFELAEITPPVGMNVYVVKGIAPHVPIEDIFRGIGMFAIMDVITIAILIAFPQISLWLPRTMY